MKILYLYDGEWPKGATRVEKETRSLARARHGVHLLCRGGMGAPRHEKWRWMTVHRTPGAGPAWLQRLLGFPLFVNPVWVYSLWRTARDVGADLLLVCDLPLAPTAVWVGRVLGVPVHYDMAEVYPEFLRSLWAVDRLGGLDHFVRSPRAAEWVERYVLRHVAKVYVVSDESAERLAQMGVAAARIAIVGNTPDDAEALSKGASPPGDIADLVGRPIILFVGILISDRGVRVAVQAMTRVIIQVPRAVLVVVGDGTERAQIEREVAGLGLQDSVRVLGWRDHSQLPGYYSCARLGLLPFLDCTHIQITLANKLFDYMAAGLAFVASDVRPMRRIVEETGAGLLAPPGDAVGLARAIVEVLTTPGLRQRLGTAGYQWSLEKYRWADDERRLLESVAS